MQPGSQFSTSYRELEEFLRGHAPDFHTVTDMVIAGDTVSDTTSVQAELDDLIYGASQFDVMVSVAYDEVENQGLVVFKGPAGQVAQLAAFMTGRSEPVSAR